MTCPAWSIPSCRAFVSGCLLSACLFLPSGALRGSDERPQLESTDGTDTGRPVWTSVEEIREAAESGDAEAGMELGLLYELGQGVDLNLEEARRWYRHAAEGGVTQADFRLARLLSEGLGGPADLRAAFEHYLRAAYDGVPLAQYNVGATLASARGVPRNYVEGLAWIIVASRHPEVDPAGEERLRARLARRPQDIMAAERRAEELLMELEARREAGENDPSPEGEQQPLRPGAPTFEAPGTVLPPIGIPAPSPVMPPMPLPRPQGVNPPAAESPVAGGFRAGF